MSGLEGDVSSLKGDFTGVKGDIAGLIAQILKVRLDDWLHFRFEPSVIPAAHSIGSQCPEGGLKAKWRG